MKKIVLLFTMVLFAGMISAQTCTKTASKASCTKAVTQTSEAVSPVTINDGQVASLIAEADALAANDETIERRECSASKKVSYFQKSVCPQSGTVSNEEVKYCGESKAFIKVASATMEADAVEGIEAPVTTKAACSSTKKSCAKSCAKKAAATQEM